MFGPWRSLASALAWGARGREFKSRRPDQFNLSFFLTKATLAQLVERLIRNQQVAGSIPAGGSMKSITSGRSLENRCSKLFNWPVELILAGALVKNPEIQRPRGHSLALP